MCRYFLGVLIANYLHNFLGKMVYCTCIDHQTVKLWFMLPPYLLHCSPNASFPSPRRDVIENWSYFFLKLGTERTNCTDISIFSHFLGYFLTNFTSQFGRIYLLKFCIVKILKLQTHKMASVKKNFQSELIYTMGQCF